MRIQLSTAATPPRLERTPGRALGRLAGPAAAAAALWLLDVVGWWFTRSHGNGLSGDEPHYLVLARMLAHGSVHPLRFYQQDSRTHALFTWPANLFATPLTFHAYAGPHGLVTIHGLGLPAALAPFVTLGGRSGGIVGLMALEAIGVVYVYTRAVSAARLGRAGRILSLLAMVGPAVWIASEQLYPDFVSGILIAVVVVDLATYEINGRLDPAAVVASSISLALLPWLHVKNLAPEAILLVALAFVAARSSGRRRPAAVVGVIAVVSCAALFAYDLWGFGRLLGLPQPGPFPSWAALTHGVGLLFDRHQGLVVQVPTVVVAAVGLWLARRIVPLAVAASVGSVLVLIYLNGCYVLAPYGGTAVAGRFSWSAMLPLLIWLPWVFREFRSLPLQWAAGIAVVAAWVCQLVPILRDQHSYYTAQVPGGVWDPSQYPGWWGPLDRLLPELVPKGPQWGTPTYALLAAVCITVAIAGLTIACCTTPPAAATRVLGGGVFGGVAVAVVTVLTPPALPSHPLVFAGGSLGSPLQAGASLVRGPSLPLQGVGPGTYTITTTGSAQGTATVSAYCDSEPPASPGPPASLQSTTIADRASTTVMTVHCHTPGAVWFSSSAEPGSRLTITDVDLQKAPG